MKGFEIMQILMGAHHTLVIIDESKVYTKNLLHYIYTNFPSMIESQNSLLLKHSLAHHHYHVFLIKWLYSLYTKINHHHIQNFKEVLVQRAHKPIKISFKNPKAQSIKVNVKVINKTSIEFYLNKDEIYYFKKVSKVLSAYPYIEIQTDRFIVDLQSKLTTLQDLQSLFKTHFKTITFVYKNHLELKSLFEEISSKKTFNANIHTALSLLNSNENDSMDIITSKYKKLRRIYHPDNVYKQANETVYKEKFQMIQNAYHIVKEELGA